MNGHPLENKVFQVLTWVVRFEIDMEYTVNISYTFLRVFRCFIW